jgi:methionine biosynthesis protein MetW
MSGRYESDQFDQIWKRKLEEGSGPLSYAPGTNLRVDKAMAALKRGSRLLDIGCGDGTLAFQAQSYFQEVYGVDIAESAVQLAQKKGVRAKMVNLNAELLPYPENFFATITILSTLQYFYNPDRVLQECYRVLAPGGSLFLSVPNLRAFWRVGKLLFWGSFPSVSKDTEGYDGGTFHYFAFANLRVLLMRQGFEVVASSGIFCLPLFFEKLTDRGWFGILKREFFSAETFLQAKKIA